MYEALQTELQRPKLPFKRNAEPDQACSISFVSLSGDWSFCEKKAELDREYAIILCMPSLARYEKHFTTELRGR